MLAASPTVHVQSTSEALKSALQIYFYVGTASELIAVDDLFYNKALNPALAIFMLLSSQLLGYGFAG